MPIHKYEILGNINKWGTGYMDQDSNIVFPLLKDTFQIHFDIDKRKENALIFSIDKIDTIGYLRTQNHIVYFMPKNKKGLYKLFDFNAKENDSYEIKYCGPLGNNILRIKDIRNCGNEIIQTIVVQKGICDEKINLPPPPPPPHKLTTIKSFIVSSKYGITEMNIFVGWANEEIKIKNAP